MEFILAMPFSRASIFLSKWLVGFGSILVSWLISFSLTGLIIKLTEIPSVHFEAYYYLLIGTLLLFYTITFSAGAITGTPFAQGLVTFTVSILPLLLVGLFGVQLEVITRKSFQFSEDILVQIFNFTPISYLFSYGMNPPDREIYPPFLMAALFFIIGFFAFMKHPFERNGSFLLWKWMERPIQIVVILLGFLGFSSFGFLSSTENSMLGYFIGAAIGACIGFIVSYFVIYKKKK
jgi:acetoin utilization transport system permease protein